MEINIKPNKKQNLQLPVILNVIIIRKEDIQELTTVSLRNMKNYKMSDKKVSTKLGQDQHN
jgi:hypothetical protein